MCILVNRYPLTANQLSIPLQENAIGDAFGEFLLVMCHHNQCFVLTLAEGVYDITNTLVINTATTIEGLSSNCGAVIRYTKYANGYTSSFVFEVRNDDAALRNLAITTASTSSSR